MTQFKELSGQCHKAAAGLKQASRTAIEKMAQVAKTEQLAAARAMGVGGTLSGAHNAKIGVNYKLMEGTPASAVVRWTGPAHLVNNPTRAHDIFPHKFAGTRGRGKKAQRGAALLGAFGVDAHATNGGIVLADGNVRHSVHHPGTHGKHFFELAAKASKLQGPKVVRNEVLKSLAQSFGG